MTELSDIAVLLGDRTPLEPPAGAHATAAARLDALIAADGAGSPRRRLRPRRTMALAVAALVVLGAGAALAESGVLHDSSPTAPQPVRHATVGVRHLNAPAPAWVKEFIDRHHGEAYKRSGEMLNFAATRAVASIDRVSPAKPPTTYYVVPLWNLPGYCMFSDQYPGSIDPVFCTHHVDRRTPWVNQPPGPHQIVPTGDELGDDDNQSAANVVVSGPLRWQPNLMAGDNVADFAPPVPLWTISGMLPAGATAAEVRYQDGSSSPIPLSGRFFVAVIQGAHGGAGARPVAVVTTGPGQRIVSTDRLSPELFHAEEYALARGVSAYTANAGELAMNEQIAIGDYNVFNRGTPSQSENSVSNFAVAISTRAKVAQMFGGTPSDYPRYSTVVVLEHGRYDYPHGLHACNNERTGDYPAICKIPAGSYAWMAMVFPAGIDLENATQSSQMRWIRLAAPGTPLPKLGPLGWVTTEHNGSSGKGQPYNRCCGNPPG